MTQPSGPTACRGPESEPPDDGRLRALADDFGRLSELLGNEDTVEVCAWLAQLFDGAKPDELHGLFAGFTRLAIVPAEDQS